MHHQNPNVSPTGKSTLTVVSFANYEWFEEWKDDKIKNRSTDYKELKQAFINNILEAVTEIFPKIKDRVWNLQTQSLSFLILILLCTVFVCLYLQIEFVDAGTPITNQHYIGAPKGEIYGADHGIPRFSPELNAIIRPQTPVKNLFLTGGCVWFCLVGLNAGFHKLFFVSWTA